MDERLARIGRLLAVAEGLEREGAYNGAKLVRAALERELVRYAAAEAPSGAAGAAQAVEALLADVGGDLPAHLRDLLPGVAAHVREGSTIPLVDAPPTRVCRACGEVLLGDDGCQACPTCESPPLAYKEMYPIWFLEPTTSEELLAALEVGRRQVVAAVEGRSDEQLAVAPQRGEWSARQTLEHLLFAEGLFAERVGRLLAEDVPDLASRAVWTETPATDGAAAATAESASKLAARFGELRATTLARLQGLARDDWQRAGNHPEWGRVTVLTQAAYFSRHQASHMAQLTAAAEGRVPSR